MNNIDATKLADMTLAMLERTAMVLAEPVEDPSAGEAPTRFASITYAGPSKGQLILEATDGFLCELAAGLLGVEATDVSVETQGIDALKEMANMLGGSVIIALSGESCEYSLGLPELKTSAAHPARSNAACTVVADGGVLRVLWVDTSASKAA